MIGSSANGAISAGHPNVAIGARPSADRARTCGLRDYRKIIFLVYCRTGGCVTVDFRSTIAVLSLARRTRPARYSAIARRPAPSLRQRPTARDRHGNRQSIAAPTISCSSVPHGNESAGLVASVMKISQCKPVIVIGAAAGVEAINKTLMTKATRTLATVPDHSRGRWSGSVERFTFARRAPRPHRQATCGRRSRNSRAHWDRANSDLSDKWLHNAPQSSAREPHQSRNAPTEFSIDLFTAAEEMSHGENPPGRARGFPGPPGTAQILGPADPQCSEIDRICEGDRSCIEWEGPMARDHPYPPVRNREGAYRRCVPSAPALERAPARAPVSMGTTPGEGRNSYNAADGGRDAQRSSRIGAGAYGEHVARQHHCGAPRRAAGVELADRTGFRSRPRPHCACWRRHQTPALIRLWR